MQQFITDHRYLLERVGQQMGFADPVAIDFDDFADPVVKASKRGPAMPIDGVLVRDWMKGSRRTYSGIRIGMRRYQIRGVEFARVQFSHHDSLCCAAFSFFAVDRCNYRRLYRIALECRRDAEPPADPPVMKDDLFQILVANTIGFLEPSRLQRIKGYRGRAKRGLLLTGPPGNGKTSACRWLWQECRRRNWEWRLVTPDSYAEARRSDNAATAVRELFTLEHVGIVFFDDLDLALRDRESSRVSDDQSVFLGALDGLETKEGIVFVFTTNCRIELIDPAFRRPGRIDVTLPFEVPDVELRRKLMSRWHSDLHEGISIDAAVRSTEGFSFAEIEELKNILVMGFMDQGEWNLEAALMQLTANRAELSLDRRPPIGFRCSTNGNHCG
jgi:hypothetical protein